MTRGDEKSSKRDVCVGRAKEKQRQRKVMVRVRQRSYKIC